jgi:hypothetical protein
VDASASLRDVTGTVAVADAHAVGAATTRILAQSFGSDGFDGGLIRAAFDDVERLFAGERGGYLACDMPYHDLRHSLDTALVMARLVAGYQRAPDVACGALDAARAIAGVVLALWHDSGFIRTACEASLCGPQLTDRHESRSIELAKAWLRSTPLAEQADLAGLIRATDLDADLASLFERHDEAAALVGRMIGSSDLLSQLSDRRYPERCYYHLYPEFVLAHSNGAASDGAQGYRDAFDLVCRTKAFCETIGSERLSRELGGVSRYLARYFEGADPYADAIRANLERFARIGEAGPSELGEEPATTTRELDPIYHAPRP